MFPITWRGPDGRGRIHHPVDVTRGVGMSAEWHGIRGIGPYAGPMDGTTPDIPDNPLAGPPPGAHPSWTRVWVPRLAGTVLVIVSVLGAASWVWAGSAEFLILLVFTVFLAFALEPVVKRLERWGMKRGVAAGITLAASLILLFVIAWAFVSLLIDQFEAIASQIPVWIESTVNWLNDAFGFSINIPDSLADAEAVVDQITNWLDDAANIVINISSGIAGGLVAGFAVIFLLYYAMADGPKLRRAILSPLPPENQRIAALVWDTSIEKTGGYVFSRIILATLSATIQTIAFWAIGLDNALALGIFVGLVSQLIPNIGTIIGGALPVLVGLVQDPILGLWALVIVTIYQQLENLLFVPRVTKETMDLHPAISFSAVIIGANLLGFTGLLLALPAAAVIQSLIQTYGKRYELIDELREDDEVEAEPAD